MTNPASERYVGIGQSSVFWGGAALTAGSLGVLVTSVLYALSPAAAALPSPDPTIAEAKSVMITGRATMVAAGTVGIIFDLLLAAGALVLVAHGRPRRLGLETAGWALVAISVLIFIVVDSLAAAVLVPTARLGDAGVFTGFKLLYDILFVLGTVAFGLGAPAVLVADSNGASPVLARPLAWSGIIVGVVGLVSGLLYFAGVGLPQVLGVSILLGTLVFAVYGIQIARSSRGAPA